jgi:hypothetical protein
MKKIIFIIIIMVMTVATAYAADSEISWWNWLATSNNTAVFLIESDTEFNTADWYVVIYDRQGRALRVMAANIPEQSLRSGGVYYQIMGFIWIDYPQASHMKFANVKTGESLRVEMSVVEERP